MASSIVVTREGDIATVVLNRPEKRNALDLPAWQGLAAAFHELDADDQLRCVLVRGAGTEAFAAGADIGAFATERKDVEAAKVYGKAEMDGIRAVADCRHPTVAMILGACVGGGLEIACACDILVAGRSSRFGAPINRLGLTMAYDELASFIEAVGRRAAMEILLEGRVFDAERALQMGIVNRVVDDADVEREALATAQRIAEGAPLVNRWHKKFARRLRDPRPLTDEDIAEGYAAFDTDDYQIGYRAFLDKTKPRFKGR